MTQITHLNSTTTRRGAPVRNLRQAGAMIQGEIKARYRQTWHPLEWHEDGRLRRDREHGSDLVLPTATLPTRS